MSTFGQNTGYVDELHARYLANPESVSEAWREFFEGWRPRAEEAAPAPGEAPEGAEALRGIAAKIVENMERSLEVPTATSVRSIPTKLLEENRTLLNRHQAQVHGPKVSFTHLIAWAILRALERHPAMNGAFASVEGIPHRVARRGVHLGLAIDVERKGERVLLVPNVKDAERLDFPGFLGAYDAMVAKARENRLAVEDFQGTTVSLTNPGTLGTSLSVPRLMEGQGTIVGTGAIGYPPEYAGMSPEWIARLGLSKTMVLTSTYDHRVIQGAESGAFLATVEQLLLGHDGFYDRIFAELAVPHDPARWSGDQNPGAGTSGSLDAIAKQAGVLQLIRAYRVRGHLSARIDPLGSPGLRQPELELAFYGLTVWDLDREFVCELAGRKSVRRLREIVDVLRETYCRHVGVEFMHVQEPEIRRWLAERLEGERPGELVDPARQRRILATLNAAEAFEKFLHSTYVGHKRFSLEGAETLVPMLDVLLDDAAEGGIVEAVIGMAHRGRLNVLCNVVGKSYGAIFREFEGEVDPASVQGSGDVKYHLGATGVHRGPGGRDVALTLASNPSHLEAVDPVVEGMARARQDAMGDAEHFRVLPLLIHGDGAFAGQGVVAETLNLSQLKGYRTGGTVHLVVNNQIGFTTGPRDARSSPYATDVARTVQAPIFHVNGDLPEEAVRVTRLALAFRNAFNRDVVIDLVCYRRWGHNEGDDPSYTHPRLYAKIERQRSVRKLYTEALLRRGDLSPEEAEGALRDFQERLRAAHEEVRLAKAEVPVPVPADREDVEGAARPAVPTAAPREALLEVLEGLDRVPPGFTIHPKLARQLAKRRESFDGDRIDWALAESLALGSIALAGTPVRLSGEDSGRGTFSQRHATLHDHETEAAFVPLAHLRPGQADFRVHDSLLSEFAVLGFDYGYSVARPEALVLWEAQFGDFVNGGQIVIDQFLASAEEKWGQRSGIVLLLPHGHEGQGPEHSSARIERFLQLCARGNLRVCNPTTPAQYFHLLRRQALDPERKPLVVFTPKSLLRHKDAVSAAKELSERGFLEAIDDPAADPLAVTRVVLCSGKLAVELEGFRREHPNPGVALVRVEQLYPWPGARLAAILRRYPALAEVLWAQEEPRNMGAWSFVAERAAPQIPGGVSIRYAGRPRNPSPATGSYRRHAAEQDAILREAMTP